MSQVKIVYTHDKGELARTQAVLDSIAARPRHPNNNNTGNETSVAQQQQQLSIKIQAIREPPRIQLDDDEDDEEENACFVPPPIFSPPPPVSSPPIPPTLASPPIPSTTQEMPTRRSEQKQTARKSVPKQALHPRTLLPSSRSSNITTTTRVDPDFPELSSSSIEANAQLVPHAAGLGPRIRPRVQPAGTGLLRPRADKSTPTIATTATSVVPLSERLHQRIKHAKVAPPSIYDSPPSSPRSGAATMQDAIESTLLGTPLRTRMMRNSSSSVKAGKPSRFGNNVTAMEQGFRASKSKAQAMLVDLSRADKDHTGLEITVLNIQSRDDMFIVFRAAACGDDAFPTNEEFDCMVSLHPFEDADNDSFLHCLGHMDAEQATRATFPLKLSVFRPWKLIRSNDDPASPQQPMLLCCGLVKVNNSV